MKARKHHKICVFQCSIIFRKVGFLPRHHTIVSVNTSGRIKGKKKGTATITAKVNGKKKICKVTIVDGKKGFIRVIKSEGYYEDGDYIIADKFEDVTYFISYSEDSDMFIFDLYDNESGTILAIGDNGNILIEMPEEFMANATVNPQKYTNKSTVEFIKTSSSISDKYLQEYCNSFLRLGFTCWDIILTKYGYSFADLGFTAY